MSHDVQSLRIAEIRRETGDAVSIVFDLPVALRDTFAFRPGQHLTLCAVIDGEEIRRSYSLCAAPHEGVWRIAVKRLPGGRFSSLVNDYLKGGDRIDVMPPSGSFTWPFEADRKASYAMFASGSGITPIMSLLKAGLESEPKSQFALFYGNRDSDSVLFLDELADLKNRHIGRLRIHHFFSREVDELDIFNGRIDDTKMEIVTRRMVDAAGLTAAFVCGPEGMMDAVETALLAAGMQAGNIFSERFGAAALGAEQQAAMALMEARAAGKRMKITVDGRTRSLAFDPELKSILDNATAAGLRTPFSCKAGVCATCRARVMRGDVEMIRNFGLSQQEVEDGYVLTCQAMPVSDDVEIDFDQ